MNAVTMHQAFFSAYKGVIDGDGYLHWEHLFVTTSTDQAAKIISGYDNKKITQGLHSSMNANNNWIYVGDRDEIEYNMEMYTFTDDVGGYVVEMQLFA
jgi:hypothetical protein